MFSQPYTFDRVVRMVLSALTLLIIFALLRYLSDVLIPFAAAIVLAYFLNPVVRTVEQKTKSRGLAVAITLTGVFLTGIVFVVIMVPLVTSQFNRFSHAWERLRNDLSSTFVTRVSASLSPPPGGKTVTTAATQPDDAATSTIGLVELRDAWEEYLTTAEQAPRAVRLQRLREHVSGTAVGTVIEDSIAYVKTGEFRALILQTLRKLAVGGATVFNFAIELILGATVVVLVLLYVVFLLMDFPEYQRSWRTFLPPTYREHITGFLDEFEIVLRRYFRGQFVIACITGLLFATAFSLIDLPLAIPFGLLVGALNMVPYAQTLAIVPALLLGVMRSLESDKSLVASIVLVLLCFGIIQIAQDGFLTPRIMGKVTGLRPIAILLGVFIWSKLLGMLGLLLAIPLTCVGIAYYRRYVLEKAVEPTIVGAG